MSQKELTRLEVIQRVKRKTLKQRQAAELLSISVRQVKRLCKAYQGSGAAGLISKRRSQPSNNRLPEKTINKARQLLRSRYPDFGPTLATEKLAIEGVSLSVETVRQLLIGEGLWKAKAVRRPVIHQLRERRARLGELVQIDGSPHDWFEGRAPKCTLLVFVDDATSRLMYLQFVAAETTFNYFAAVRSYLTAFGKPLAFYSDKFGVFRVNMPNALSGTGLTQFGRALKELDIELICAHSPQAKGRVERANQTLQDRLTKELRLRDLSSPAAANAYLPEFIAEYNQRFAVVPRSAESAHRPLAKGEDLERVLVLCERRTLSKNLTLSYNSVIYQIKTKRPSYTMRGAHVEVREKSNGELEIEYKKRPLEYSIYRAQEQQQAKVVEAKLLQPAAPRGAAQPKQKPELVPLSHPWKRFGVSKNSLQAKERRGELCSLRK
ncbi:MAG TPA: ISNCY family transposase [Pyrinomonadaceae bacterium]|nr:ISNCY family transposase [Pyrinomonadaceae bacterium]